MHNLIHAAVEAVSDWWRGPLTMIHRSGMMTTLTMHYQRDDDPAGGDGPVSQPKGILLTPRYS